jgi:hypothetical protein
MSILNNNMLLKGGTGTPTPPTPTPTPYTITNSFQNRDKGIYGTKDPNDSTSGQLGLDPSFPVLILESSNAGNGSTKFTFSFWIKGYLNGTDVLVDPGTGDKIYFQYNQLTIVSDPFFSRGEYFSANTYATFKDTTAWYHFVVSVDTTQATDADRLKIYCNGVSLKWTDSYAPTQNQTFSFYEGDLAIDNSSMAANTAFADIKFVDNQSLTAASFGEFDSTTGVWKPKEYTFSNSSGDNSFELLFEDTDSTTATDFGKDTSGNSLNFTPYQIIGRNGTDDSYSAHIMSDTSSPDSYISIGAVGSLGVGDSASKLDVASGTNWTLEFWVYFHSADLGYMNPILYGNDDYYYNFNDPTSWVSASYDFSNGLNLTFAYDYGSANISTNGLCKIYPKYFYHVAICLSGSTGRFFVNGDQITTWTDYGTEVYAFNNNDYTKIGGDSTNYFNGYISNLRFVKGTALYTSSFTPPTTALTAITNTQLLTCRGSAINDASGNSITISTTGAVRAVKVSPFDELPIYNWCKDTPTATGTDTGAGGEQSGSYCVIDNKGYYLSNANPVSSFDRTPVLSSLSFDSGKWYWEVSIDGLDVLPDADLAFGVVADRNSLVIDTTSPTDLTTASSPNSHLISTDSKFYNNGSSTSNSTPIYVGDILGIALDVTNNQIKYYKNGALIGSAQTLESGQTWTPVYLETSVYYAFAVHYTFNFGQTEWFYAAPTGFKPCAVNNLATPSIVNPKDYVDTLAWKGNGTSQSFSSLGFDPGLVFITQWTDSNNFTSVGPRHVYDKNNGAQSALYLNTNDTPQTATTGLTAFQTGGFTLGSADAVNESDEFYTAVCFATPASSSSNTSGSISSTVRANTTSKVSVIDYTGTSGNATVGHGLSITPSLILVKNESSSQDWVVWHKEIANNQYLGLNGEYDFPSTSSTMWNNTSPTTNVFSVGTNANTNSSGNNYKAYCFGEVNGFSKAGKYTISDYETEKKIYLGFKPEVIWIKAIAGASGSQSSEGSGTYWYQCTGARNKQLDTSSNENQGPYPKAGSLEELGTSHAFGTILSYTAINIHSNGFTVDCVSYEYPVGCNGYTYVYFAWASAPIKYALSGY